MSRTQDAAVAFAFGALAGGVAALLLAPEKGEVTRKRLKEGAKGLIEHGETLACEVRGAMAEGAKAYCEELDRAHA